jgi:hypothetical protein
MKFALIYQVQLPKPWTDVSEYRLFQFPMGSPEDCIKFIEQFAAVGVEELMFNFQLGPVTHAEVMQSIRLFGTQVIPYFWA